VVGFGRTVNTPGQTVYVRYRTPRRLEEINNPEHRLSAQQGHGRYVLMYLVVDVPVDARNQAGRRS
jgi:hypothetical protein